MTLRLRPARCPTSRKMGRGGRAQIARDVFVSAERLAEICPSFLNPTAIRKIDGALLHAAILRGGPAEASGPFRVDGIVPVSYTHLDVYKRQIHGKGGVRADAVVLGNRGALGLAEDIVLLAAVVALEIGHILDERQRCV